jgi:hypothetical protein
MPLRFIAVNLLNFFLAIVEGFLGLRFLLKLFGANANAGFVDWVYEMSSGLLDPFRGIFPAQTFENRYVFEFSTLFAMLMYAIVGLILIYLINAITAVAETSTDETVVRRRR